MVIALTTVSVLPAQNSSNAFVKISKDTTVNADTSLVSIFNVPSHIKAFHARIVTLSGTTGGYALLQGFIDNDWEDVNTDTLKLTTAAYKTWKITRTEYDSYRIWFKSTGTQTSIVRFAYLRRQDED